MSREVITQCICSHNGHNLLGPRTWPCKVTWHHRSHDHSTNNMLFPIVSHWNRASILNHFRDICIEIYRGNDLDLSGYVTPPVTWPIDTPGTISYRCSIVTESISSHWRDKGPQIYWGHDLTFLGPTVTWPIDLPHALSYWWPIYTESLSLTVFQIFASKYIWVTTLTFEGHVTSPVTWPFHTPDATADIRGSK